MRSGKEVTQKSLTAEQKNLRRLLQEENVSALFAKNEYGVLTAQFDLDDLDAEDENGNTVLSVLYPSESQAFLNTFYRVIEKLFYEKGRLNVQKTISSRTLLQWATLLNQSTQIARTLMVLGVPINAQNRWGWTVLHNMIFLGRIELFKEFFYPLRVDSPNKSSRCAMVNTRSDTGKTPLYLAANKGNLEMVRILLLNGADPNIVIVGNSNRHCNGATPLHIAAERGLNDIVDLLCQSGAKVNTAKADGDTPLIRACSAGHDTTVRLLLSLGANQELAEFDQHSRPLHIVCKKGHVAAAEVLINNGADLAALDKDQVSPLILANNYRHFKITSCLLTKRVTDKLIPESDHTIKLKR